MAENSLNLQNIEPAVRKGLLPTQVKRLVMNRAEEVIEHVVQNTRFGLARARGAA